MRFSPLFVCFFLFAGVLSAQETLVTDHKGTKKIVASNTVTTTATAPTSPVEGDVWFDATSRSTKIWQGDPAIWKDLTPIVSLWQSNTDGGLYAVDDIVSYNGILYKNLTATNTNLSPDNDPTNWGYAIASGAADEPWYTVGTTTGHTSNTGDMFFMGQVAIGNASPDPNAILDLTNSVDKAFLLPSETLQSNISSPTDGMLVYSSDNNNAYLRAESAWKPFAHNLVTNELIFDGEDDTDVTNDNFYYVSFVVNGDWKVVRYDKTDVNIELQATLSNNSGQLAQPIDLLTCTALTYD